MGESDLKGGRRERMEDGWNAPLLQVAVTVVKVAFDSCSVFTVEEKINEGGRVVEPCGGGGGEVQCCDGGWEGRWW